MHKKSNTIKFISVTAIIFVISVSFEELSLNSVIAGLLIALFFALILKPFYEENKQTKPVHSDQNVNSLKNMTKAEIVGRGVEFSFIGFGILALAFFGLIAILFASIGLGSL